MKRYDASIKTDLLAAEQSVLNILKDSISSMKMLDIGVGGGRTTAHFLPKVREYVGVDISKGMIDACRQLFSERSDKAKFAVCDASAMDFFEKEQFDFVLFSFNGIDHVPVNLRARVFQEVKRVLKPGGYFCFSTHNIQSVESLNKIELYKSPFWSGVSILKALFVSLLNRNLKKIKSEDTALVKEWLDFEFYSTFYIKPKIQIQQLEELGFIEARTFGGDGVEITSSDVLKANLERWIYYLAKKK